MARIPTYTADRLASEQVGVPRQDQSGVILANAVTNLAGTAYDAISAELAKQQQAKEMLDVSAAKTQYQTQYLRAKQEITSDPAVTSDKVEELLNERSSQISSQLLSDLPSGSTRQAVQTAIQLDQDVFKVDAAKERVVLANKETYNKWFNTIETTIENMKATGTAESYEATIKGFHAMTPAVVPLVGDNLENAQKATQNAIDSATTQFVAAGIENGQEDQLEQMRILGKFNQASETTQKRVDATLTEALKTKAYRADITTAYNTLNDNVADVEAIRAKNKTFSDIEHDLSATTYELATGNFSASQKEDMQRRINTLDALRKAMLMGAYTRGSDNLDVKTDLATQAVRLIKQADGEKGRAEGVYLSDLKKYQDRLVSEFVDKQNISGKTFNDLYADVYGVMLKDLSQKTFEQSGWEKFIHATPAATAEVLPKDERKPLFRIYDAAKQPDGSVDPNIMLKAYDEYQADKKAGKTIGDSLTSEQADEYFTRANLRQQGFSGVYKVGDNFPTKRGPRKILGFESGNVIIEETEQDRQTVKYFKQFGGGVTKR